MDFTTERVEGRQEQRVRVVVRIDGAEPVPWSYSRTGKMWRPTGATATFERTRHHGQEWTGWTLLSGRIVGRNILANGREGAERDERVYRYDKDGPVMVYLHALRARLNAAGPDAGPVTLEPGAVEMADTVEQPPTA